jgi:hypothetical protein
VSTVGRFTTELRHVPCRTRPCWESASQELINQVSGKRTMHHLDDLILCWLSWLLCSCSGTVLGLFALEQLEAAAEQGDLQETRRLVEELGVDINAKSWVTPCMHALNAVTKQSQSPGG